VSPARHLQRAKHSVIANLPNLRLQKQQKQAKAPSLPLQHLFHVTSKCKAACLPPQLPSCKFGANCGSTSQTTTPLCPH
jgi:hypothetical protein